MPLTALASSAIIYIVLLVYFSLKPARKTPRWSWTELAVSTIFFAITLGVLATFLHLGESSFGSTLAYVASYTAMYSLAKVSAYHVHSWRHKRWKFKQAIALVTSVPPPPLRPLTGRSGLNPGQTWQQPPPENSQPARPDQATDDLR
jgi:uncharacterized membrane protein YbhN (UPF0104 family)